MTETTRRQIETIEANLYLGNVFLPHLDKRFLPDQELIQLVLGEGKIRTKKQDEEMYKQFVSESVEGARVTKYQYIEDAYSNARNIIGHDGLRVIWMTESVAEIVTKTNSKEVLTTSGQMYVVEYRDARDQLINPVYKALLISRGFQDANFSLRDLGYLFSHDIGLLQKELTGGIYRLPFHDNMVFLPSVLRNYQEKIRRLSER